VSGDFFLYPEEALADITNALAGLPADLPVSELAARVAAAIPPGTEWLGSSADALAIAVDRARTESGIADA
jgi:lipoate-protein ligase A